MLAFHTVMLRGHFLTIFLLIPMQGRNLGGREYEVAGHLGVVCVECPAREHVPHEYVRTHLKSKRDIAIISEPLTIRAVRLRRVTPSNRPCIPEPPSGI